MPELTTRLYITPLNPELLEAVLGTRLSSYANTVTYHSVQSSPDSPFGYLNLPTMEATKIKKKLNGAILKGKKMKIEEARPQKRTLAESEESASSEAEATSARRSKRTKGNHDTIPGRELSPDRKVKRGWTEPKAEKRSSSDKKKKDKTEKKIKPQAPSKHTDKAELLFRTKVPANKVTEETKEKRRKGKKGDGAADVVHEFEKTLSMPSFLRHSVDKDAKQATEYRDGEGWVDENGTVVEEETTMASKKRKAAKRGLEIDVDKAEAANIQKQAKQMPLSPPPSKSNSAVGKGMTEVEDENSNSDISSSSEELDETSSSGSSSEEEISEDESEKVSDDEEDVSEAVAATTTSTEPVPQQTTTTIIAPSTAAPTVHPLEALFKKPRIPSPPSSTTASYNQNQVTTPRSSNPPLSATSIHSNTSTTSSSSGKQRPSLEKLSTSFSFFDNDAEEDPNPLPTIQATTPSQPHNTSNNIIKTQTLGLAPMTPFTTQDFRFRSIRSAAPTPDTGDIRKSTGYGSLILGEDDPDEELSDFEDYHRDQETDSKDQKTTEGKKEQSEFEKRFWEQRGDNNRAWKARRRVVLKEQRQRENRSRRPRGF